MPTCHCHLFSIVCFIYSHLFAHSFIHLQLLLSILFYLFVRRGMCTSGAIWTYLALETISLILRVVNTFIERSQFNVRTDTTLVINCLITVILFVQSFLSDSPSNHLKVSKYLFVVYLTAMRANERPPFFFFFLVDWGKLLVCFIFFLVCQFDSPFQ